jgi:asparagine synthase (glutamine-hydrolysing)
MFSSRLRLARAALTDRAAYSVVSGVRRRGLTFLDPGALLDLYARVQEVEAARLPGLLVEAGTALGGSAVVMARAKAQNRPLRLYDAFGMIPPPSANDGADAQARYAEIAAGQAAGIAGGIYYGYQENLEGKVRAALAEFGCEPDEHNITLVKGFYEETLHVDGPVALAHLDCDWYDSVMVCLDRLVPRLATGGILVVDDYGHWSGCKRAVDEYFAGRQGFRFEQRSRLHVVRTA